MKNIMRRIREYLNRKAVKRKLRSAISILSCIVVFSTTYALLLPALTLEAETICGMEEHEHTDDCYTRVLICGQEESEGHQHTDECYDEEHNLICGQEESEGHQHTDDCYEMQLTCGKEVHIHSEECYKREEPEAADTSEDSAEEVSEDATESATEDGDDGATQSSAADATQSGAADAAQSGAAGTTEAAAAATTQKAADVAEPEKLKEINLERLLTGRTGIFYIPENGGSDDWEKLDGSTKLDPEQDVILHIAFEIPAGKLNATNAKTEYELPLSISMTEDEVEDINKYESRIFIGTDREADDLGNGGSFEIEEEYNGNGDVTERKAVITFNSDTCVKVGGEKLTDGTVITKPESIEGFIEMTISAEDLLTLETAGEAKYALEWNDDSSLDTYVTFDADKLQAYLDEKNGKTEEASAAETVEESAAAATTEEIAKAEEETATAEEAAKTEETEAEPAQEEAPAAAYASGKLDYDGGSYTVTASFDESAKLPEGVQLNVKELTGASYQKYLSEANEAVGEKKEVTGGRFFDITFTDAEGKPVEPQGMVDVRISYKNTETIEEGTSVEGVHFTEQGAQTIDVDAKGVAENTVDVVGFQSDSFSVYGVVYTVDFEYTDSTTGETYYYSIDGGTSINLTELLVLLGIKTEENVEEFVANQVENVEFSDPELVKVTHNGKFLGLFGKDDWKLESLQPFNTEEMLTISLKNGSKIKIVVRDLQYTTSLNDVLTDLTIAGAEWDAATNSYVVKKGKSYTVNMNFQEGEGNGQYQFSNDGWMTLTLPAGITFETNGTFNIYVNEAGENYTITGNMVEVAGNSIRVKLNTADPNYQKLKDLTTAKFTVSATGRFDSNSSGYVIDGQTDTKIKVDDTPDVSINKTGSVVDWNSSATTAKVKYRLEVKSNGEATGVDIKDTIEGTGLTYDQNSVTVTLDGQPVSGWTTTAQSNTGFSMKTGTLQDGKTYVVEYTATINKADLIDNGNGSYSLGASNKVDWTGDKTTTHDLGHVVNKPGITKSGSTKEQSGSVTTTTWTIQADSDYGENNQLKNITDRMASDGMQYVGDGIRVVVTNKDDNSVIKDQVIPWSQIRAGDGKSWTYDVSQLVDNAGKKYHYTITYDTQYDIGNVTTGQTIKNDYEDNRDNEGEGQAWVNPNPENRYGLDKQFTSKEIDSGNTIVTWTIRVTVPASGVSAADAVLTDVLPSTGNYQDTFVSYESVSGLYSGETVDVDSTSDPTKVIFTFKNNGNAGLAASTDGKAREIVLTLKTKCDPAWMADEEADLTHTNEAIFHNEHKTAHYTPDKPSIEKTGKRDGEDGGLPKFSYSIKAGVFSDDIFTHPYPNTEVGSDAQGQYVVIEDTFDERLAFVDGSATVGGGDQYSQEGGRGTSGVTATVSGNKITFKLYKDSLPKNNGNLYQYYKINYSLKVKDEATLIALRDEAIAQGKAVELKNTVTGFGGSEVTVNYEPKILDKSHQVVDNKLVFTVKVNEEGLKLSDNGVLVLTDSMTNLSVRYQDITVEVAGNKTVETTDAEGNPVTAPYFNMKGNDITFYIPDEAAVTITYRATPRGEIGTDGKIHYSNTVKLKGFEKTDSGEKEYENEASGYGTNYAVYIYKADGNVNSNALAGAVFKLYEADEVDANGNIISGTPVKNSDGSDYTVTTSDGKDGGQKGIVRVMGTEDLGWNLKPEKRYYLLETKAPEGYALDNTKYSFIISKDGYVNYTSKPVVAPDGSGKLVQAWTYHNGDVMTMKDWRKDGVLTLEKGFENIDPAKMDDDQKAAIKFDIYTINEDGTETLWRTITYDQFSAETDEEGKVSYKYTIGDLQEGKYKVVESVDDVTCKNTTYEVVDPDNGAGANNDSENKDERYATIVISAEDVRDHTDNQVIVKNTYDEPSEFKIYKHAEGETSYKLANAEFGVYEVDASGAIIEPAVATYKTNSRGHFTILQTGEDGKAELQTGKVYALQETKAPAGFLLNEQIKYFCFLAQGEESLPDSVPQRIEITPIPWKTDVEQNIEDTPDTTYLEAKKVYLNELLDVDETISTPVEVRVKQVATYDKEGTVIEPELSGYYKIDSAKPVKEGQQATVFNVIKDPDTGEWHLEDDGVHVIDGKLIGLPTMTFDNHIPIYYSYQIEENAVPGYLPSYEYEKQEDGSTIATVTNKPNSTAPTTRVKAKKKWVDVAGNDITSKMGTDESISVDVYRYAGELTRGTIYEADGTVRDAGQLYSITFDDGNNGTEKKSISCLPGDRIRYKIKAFRFNNNKTIDTAPVSVKCNQTEALGTVTKTIDTDNNEITFEFTAPTDNGNREIRMEIQEISSYELSSENITAEGRTQVLTQADLAAIDNKEKVETLELNAQNGWSNISKEYVTRAAVGYQTVNYTYFILEPEGSNYEAEYRIEGDTITTVNIDKKLEVDKKWLASNGDDITAGKEDGEITYTIKRNKYKIDPPATASINYSELKAGGKNINAESIASNIKVGSTIKITVKIKDRTPTAEDSPLDGMVIEGGNVVSSTSAYRVNTYNPTQYDWMRDYFVEVTDTTVKLSGNLVTTPNFGDQAKLLVSIQKEPSAVVTPPEGAEPEGEPEEVGTVTVKNDAIVSYSFAETFKDATVDTGTDPWSAVVKKLPAIDDQGNIYTYSVTEAVGEDFEQVKVDEEGNITVYSGPVSAALGDKAEVINRLKPGSLKVKKVVEGANPNKTYEIAVTDSDGNYYGADGKNYGSTPHYETFSAGNEKTWTPMTPGTYTVSEKDASEEGYTWTVTGTDSVKVERGATAESTVTNNYFKTTEYTPKVTKSLKVGDQEVSPWPAGASFDFYLSFDESQSVGVTKTDVVMRNREATATESSKTATFDYTNPSTAVVQEGLEFKKPGTYVFTIEEVEPAGTKDHKKNGIVYSTEKVTLTVVVEESSPLLNPGVLEVTSKTYSPANGEAEEGLITNTLDYPTYAPSVTKKLMENGVEVAETDWAGKSFTFDLAMSDSMTDEQKANVIMPSTIQKTVDENSENHKETFDGIAFKAEGTYTFTVTEQAGTDSKITYDTTPKSIEVTVEPDTDGNLSVTKVTIDGTEITGDSIVGSGVTVENTLIKEKEFKFKKIWLDDNTDSAKSVEWVKPITVELYGKETGKADTKISDYEVTYPAPQGAAYTAELKNETIDGKSYKSYEFTIKKLDAKYESFYVKEKDLDGYLISYKAVQESDGTISFVPAQGKDHADEGDYIVNSLISVALPSTGGFGTTPFYTIGLLLIALAAGLYTYLNRKNLIAIRSDRRTSGTGRGKNRRRGGDGL